MTIGRGDGARVPRCNGTRRRRAAGRFAWRGVLARAGVAALGDPPDRVLRSQGRCRPCDRRDRPLRVYVETQARASTATTVCSGGLRILPGRCPTSSRRNSSWLALFGCFGHLNESKRYPAALARAFATSGRRAPRRAAVAFRRAEAPGFDLAGRPSGSRLDGDGVVREPYVEEARLGGRSWRRATPASPRFGRPRWGDVGKARSERFRPAKASRRQRRWLVRKSCPMTSR